MYVPPDMVFGRNPLQLVRPRLLTRITAPVSEPLTLEQVKLYLRMDGDEEDDLIADLIVAARIMAETWLKRSLITQSWKVAYDDGLPDSVRLPMGPVNSVADVTIVHRNGSTLSLNHNTYVLNAAKTILMFDTLVIGFRIEITYHTGYGDADDVPMPIKQGMLAHIAAMYDSRGEAGGNALPPQAAALYMPFREVSL